MEKLKTLLNALIEKGWKPWEMDANKIEHIIAKRFSVFYDQKGSEEQILKNIRELVSLESGLWQFCVEKELVKAETSESLIRRYVKELVKRKEGDIIEAEVLSFDLECNYRIIESALVPEKRLAKFLIDNIKV